MSKSSRKKKRNSAADIGKQEARISSGQRMLDRPKESICQGGGRTRLSSRYYDWVFLGLTLLFVVIVRTRLLGFPFERDEGEYAYLGQLIQQGIPPYSIAYNMKLPGTYFMYAVIMSLFGQTIMAVHLGLMLINCVTILLIYKISAKIVNSFAGTIAAFTYALLALSPSVLGFAAHATHFVVFWAMAGLLVLLYALEKNRSYLYFASGALLALAFVMKQPGIFFVFWGAAHIVLDRCQNKSFRLKRVFSSLSMFLCGVLVVVFIMIIYLYASGVFDKFWFFTFVYLFKYGSKIPLSMAADSFMAMFPRIVDGFFLIWVFAGLGLVSLFLHSRLQRTRIPVSLFAVCSFLTVCPGFYFRHHYFILLLPVVSLLTGIFIDSVYARSKSAFATRVSVFKRALPRCIAVALFALAVMIGVVNQSEYLFEKDLVSLCRSIYGNNPFPESVEIGRFIERNTAITDKIAVIGSEPQIYFYSKRRSATGYIYTYDLMEMHDYSRAMQKEMAEEIERANPKSIVFVGVGSSWLVRPGSDRFIFRWADAYLRRYYNLVGVVDILGTGNTVYKWFDDARSYIPQSNANLFIFQRG